MVVVVGRGGRFFADDAPFADGVDREGLEVTDAWEGREAAGLAAGAAEGAGRLTEIFSVLVPSLIPIAEKEEALSVMATRGSGLDTLPEVTVEASPHPLR